jgi:hypothetical protein
MTIYPLPMRFPASFAHVDVIVDRTGWTFATDDDADNFGELPTAERLELRAAFEGQVALAKDTPADWTQDPNMGHRPARGY